MKIYVEVQDGRVTGVYTDDKNTDIDFILCDRDDARQETEEDGFEFARTNDCNELDKIIKELRCLY